MKTIILSGGEIGKSLYNVLSKEYDCAIYDMNSDKCINNYSPEEGFEIMHVAIPYSERFIEQIEEYKETYKPKYTIIHSTVPIGISRQLNSIHSPVVGLHPNLSESLTTFTKFLGGEQASEVANYFRRAGIKIHLEDKQETTELLKIQSTTFYALMIEFCKDMKKQCDKYYVPYSSFLIWNENYNKGYEKLGYPEYKKPLLQPIMKKQGGHCTLPNLKLIDTKFTKLLKELNK